jgi:hypothetical protein
MMICLIVNCQLSVPDCPVFGKLSWENIVLDPISQTYFNYLLYIYVHRVLIGKLEGKRLLGRH